MPGNPRRNNTPRLPTLPRQHPEVMKLTEDIERLRECALNEARGAVKRYADTSRDRFIPSRLLKSKRAATDLAAVFYQAWPSAIASRLPQIRTLDAKRARICPDWPRHTDEQLSKAFDWDPCS